MKARMRIVGLGATVVALALSAGAEAATINVKPKPNALQNAIDDAKKGDKLVVRDGTYREDVRVTKPLEIVGADGTKPVITGSCDTDIVIDVQSRGVTLEHLKVKGADDGGGPGYTVNLIGVPTGTVKDLSIQQSCQDSPEYGINIFDAGNLKILDNHIYDGFEDTGIYVGGINDTRGKSLLVDGNESEGNNRGIIIEDSFSNDQSIVVSNNNTHDNDADGFTPTPTGIFVHNSDNGLYENNTVSDNGAFGFDIDDPSDDNEFRNNTATGNGNNGADNFHDLGSGSCGSGNTGFTVPGCM
jgi:parallel beta-helix repeat protein